MVYLKSLIVLQETYKHSGNFKFNIFEKTCKFTYENLNRKLLFYPFLSDLPGILSFYTARVNKTSFYGKSFSFPAGGIFPPPAGPLCCFVARIDIICL